MPQELSLCEVLLGAVAMSATSCLAPCLPPAPRKRRGTLNAPQQFERREVVDASPPRKVNEEDEFLVLE